MRSLFLLMSLLLLGSPAVAADPLTGLWLTQGRDGVISISNCDGGLCGEIVGVFLDRPTEPMPRDYRGVSQCHLQLITDARQVRPGLWKGHIIDPRNGSIYGVELRLDSRGNLALRGFVGVPLLGKTQTWTRYQGPTPDDCRIQPAAAARPRTLPSVPKRVQ